MVQEVDYIRLQNNLTLNQCNMHLEIEKIKKECSDLYGFQELTLLPESWIFHTQN